MRMTLPFEDEIPTPPAPDSSESVEPVRRLSNFKILIVEDDPAGRRMLAALLAADGAVVQSCSDGDEALRMARAFDPDLAVVDLALPGMSGLIVFDELRKLPGCDGIVGIAVSALNGPRIERLVEQSGFAAFVHKPINLDELLSLAARLLEARS